MLESDRLRITMLLTEKLSVRRIAPSDDDYSGTDGHYEFRIEGIADAAEALATERDLLLRLIESAHRHSTTAQTAFLVGADYDAQTHQKVANAELTAAIALLREGKVPAQMMEGVG